MWAPVAWYLFWSAWVRSWEPEPPAGRDARLAP